MAFFLPSFIISFKININSELSERLVDHMERSRGLEHRMEYFDYLRILATFAVMMLHISAHNFYLADVRLWEWNVLNIYDSIVRWAVPVFVMMSGALFLGGTQSLEQILKKNVKRILTALLFWSVLYAVVVYFATGCGIKNAVAEVFIGHYHLWFLFMLTGLYLIVPFLRKIVESEQLMKYFLLLSFLFSFVLPQLLSIVSLYSEFAGSVISRMLDNVNFHFALNYVYYFVCGYYLNQISLDQKRRRIIYIMGIAGFLATIVMTAGISIWKQEAQETFYGYFTINVMLEGILIFVLAKQWFGKIAASEKQKRFVRKLSEYSFGAYLVHALVIEALNLFQIHSLAFTPVLAVPLISILVFVISYLISCMLHHIPLLKKYIV